MLYLLKELLIGFDALVDIFGTFEPKEEMIMVNRAYKWKIWINQDFHRNEKDETAKEIGTR